MSARTVFRSSGGMGAVSRHLPGLSVAMRTELAPNPHAAGSVAGRPA
ncbi:hypothetical protein [Nocardia xishanensis]